LKKTKVILAVLVALSAVVFVSLRPSRDNSALLKAAKAAHEKEDYQTTVAILKPLAESGVAEAQDLLAKNYMFGLGVPQDVDEAFRLIQLSAEQGYPEGQLSLGAFYGNGLGKLKKNKLEALRWYRLAADQGVPQAYYNIGVLLYEGGEGLPKDLPQAKAMLRKAADLGVKNATTVMEDILEDEIIEAVKREDFDAALRIAEPLAKRGDGFGEYTLAWILLNQKKMEDVYKWLQKSAEHGYPRAQVKLGNLSLESGNGSEAIAWYRKAAESGDGRGQFFLAEALWSGVGVSKNTKEAFEWYLKAAKADNPAACTTLGIIFLYGLSVEKDVELATKWLDKAIATDTDAGEFARGLKHKFGLGGWRNTEVARNYLQSASDQ
jgi:TPR repeat protein